MPGVSSESFDFFMAPSYHFSSLFPPTRSDKSVFLSSLLGAGQETKEVSDHVGRETGWHHTAPFRGDHTLVMFMGEDIYSNQEDSSNSLILCTC